MPRYRHVIHTRGDGLPGHLARTLCGRTVAYGRQPNVPAATRASALAVHALDETAVSLAPIDLVVGAPASDRRTPPPKEES